MTAKPEKKRNIWREHALYIPVAVMAMVACGVGFFVAYAHGHFTNNSIFEIFFYMLFWYCAFCISLIYMLHYFVAGKDERNGRDIGRSVLFCVTLFLGILGMMDAYSAKPLLVGVDMPITLEALLGGILAAWGLFLLNRRTENQDKQLQHQIKQFASQIRGETHDRYRAAVASLGNLDESVRMEGIYSMHQLAVESNEAIETDRYRKQIAQILCSHIRSKTQEERYQAQHKDRPSNEIQTAIDILFRDVNGVKGLYCQNFSQEREFPKANLSHAYLQGADFRSAKCRSADFTDAQCQNVNFLFASCQRAKFLFAKCWGAHFCFSECQKTIFGYSELWGADFSKAGCQEASFESAKCQGANFSEVECQGANFSGAKCQGAYFSDVQCQGGSFDNTAFQGAKFKDTNFEGAYSNAKEKISLEKRVGETTEVTTAIFSGPFSLEREKQIMGEDIPYYLYFWNEEMQETQKASEDESLSHDIPEGIIVGVLEDSEEIRWVIKMLKTQ